MYPRYVVDMAGVFHVRPWEHDALTIWDYFRFVNALDRIREERANGS